MGCGSSSSADTTDSSHNRPSHRDDNDNHGNRRDRGDSEPSGGSSEDDFVNEALNAHNDFRYWTKTQGDMSLVFDITIRQPPR